MDTEARINQIKQELRQIMQQISALAEEPPPEVQELLMRVIEKSTKEIAELREQKRQEEFKAPAPAISAPVSNDAQLLWILSGQQEQPFINYLREYPSNETQTLLANPTLLSQTISQLSQMMPQGTPSFVNGIQHADLNSSNIWGTAYDQKTGKMRVRFQGGSEYEYEGVPANIYRAFSKGNASAKTKGKNKYGEWFRGKNPSLGAAMNQYIKAGGFPYRKLT